MKIFELVDRVRNLESEIEDLRNALAALGHRRGGKEDKEDIEKDKRTSTQLLWREYKSKCKELQELLNATIVGYEPQPKE